MNLEDVIDENGLQQDKWSLSKPRFGEEGQLEVIGWSGKSGSKKYYILKCNKCSQDGELFGEGYFKASRYNLLKPAIPCGCSYHPQWSKDQYSTLCARKSKELGNIFIGFEGEWRGHKTKVIQSCLKHGEWGSGSITGLINGGSGCKGCQHDIIGEAHSKPDYDMIESFHLSGSYHPYTKFWRSGRLNSNGYTGYWYYLCGKCGEKGESWSSKLQLGQLSCACNLHRQQECYINWIVDDRENAVAIKFGIARDSKQRIKSQDRQSLYEVRQYQVYTFPSVQQCKQAERECKKELECGVVLKRDMPDGWTETTWSYNIGKVVDIYKRNGGVMV